MGAVREYLYGPAAIGASGRSTEPTAIPGRRAPAYLAGRFANVVRSLMAEALEPYGVTQQQWGVMVAIVREPGCDQRGIAERQNIDVNSASRLIDELEAMNLVRRMPSASDRRVNHVALTPAGVRMRGQLQGGVIAAQDRVLASLEQDEKSVLLDLLTRVVESSRDYARPGAGRRKPVKKAKPVASQPGELV